MISDPPFAGGRYVLGDAIGSGGMATVHLARQCGPLGHSCIVAVKRLRREYARDPELVAMLLDEARLTARVRHSNVVPLLDVVAEGSDLLLVLEYVAGVPLSWLISKARQTQTLIPLAVVVAVGIDMLEGLHAIHEARDDRGKSLHIVHRDVSPQNVIVGEDGVVRLLDLGVAKAARRAQTTRIGELKGKIAYMAPEQLELRDIDGRADVYAAAVVLWELCAGRRLHERESARELVDAIALGPDGFALARASEAEAKAVETEITRALCYAAKGRHASALDFARALAAACPPAPRWEVRDWVSRLGQPILDERAKLVSRLERGVRSSLRAPPRVVQGVEPVTERAAAITDSQPGVSASAAPGARSSWNTALVLGALLAVSAIFGLREFTRPHATPERVPAAERTDPLPVAPRLPSDSLPAESSSARAVLNTEAPAAVGRRALRTLPVASPTRGRPPAPVSSASGHSPDCLPPYRTDGSGVRVYKEECL